MVIPIEIDSHMYVVGHSAKPSSPYSSRHASQSSSPGFRHTYKADSSLPISSIYADIKGAFINYQGGGRAVVNEAHNC